MLTPFNIGMLLALGLSLMVGIPVTIYYLAYARHHRLRLKNQPSSVRTIVVEPVRDPDQQVICMWATN